MKIIIAIIVILLGTSLIASIAAVMAIGLFLLAALHVVAFIVGSIRGIAAYQHGITLYLPDANSAEFIGGLLGLLALWIGLGLKHTYDERLRIEEEAKKRAEEREKRREEREQRRQILLIARQKREIELAQANPITRKIRTWLRI